MDISTDTPPAPLQPQIVAAGPVMIVLETAEAEEFARLDARLPLELRGKLAQLAVAGRGRSRDTHAGEHLEMLQHRRRSMTARRSS